MNKVLKIRFNPIFYALTIFLFPGIVGLQGCKQTGTSSHPQHALAPQFSSYDELGALQAKIHDLQQLVAKQPNSARIHDQLGMAYYQYGDYPKAIIQFYKSITINPQALSIRYYLGMCYYEQGNYRKAASIFRETAAIAQRHIASGTKKAFYYYVLGLCEKKLLQSQQAIATFKTTLYLPLTPWQKADVYENLGECYWDINRYELAATAFQKSLRLNPKETDALFWLGAWEASRRHYGAALSLFTRAIQFSEAGTERASYYVALGKLEMQLGHLSEAKRAFQQALHNDPTNAYALKALKKLP